jgi:hypothetical protein
MKNNYSKLPYILAILLGFVGPFIPDTNPFPFILALVYLLSGGVLGYFWPGESWRWGLWIAGPVIVLVSLSVLFSGQIEIFLKKDLIILVVTLVAACLGGFIFARLRKSRMSHTGI